MEIRRKQPTNDLARQTTKKANETPEKPFCLRDFSECHRCHVHFYRISVFPRFRNIWRRHVQQRPFWARKYARLFNRRNCRKCASAVRLPFCFCLAGCRRGFLRIRSAWIQLALHISRGIKMLTCLNSGKCFVYATSCGVAFFCHCNGTRKVPYCVFSYSGEISKRNTKKPKIQHPIFSRAAVVASQPVHSIKCFNISHTGNAGYFWWQH